MIRKLSVGVLSAALLLSGALVGVSYGGPGGITEPQVIELQVDPCSVRCRHYPLVEFDGPQTGQVTMSRNPIFDTNGDKIGTLDFSCTVSDGRGGPTGFLCTNVITLKESSTAAAGTIVATGLYKGEDDDVFAITGGTGAYQDVGGYVVQGEEYTVHLIP